MFTAEWILLTLTHTLSHSSSVTFGKLIGTTKFIRCGTFLNNVTKSQVKSRFESRLKFCLKSRLACSKWHIGLAGSLSLELTLCVCVCAHLVIFLRLFDGCHNAYTPSVTRTLSGTARQAQRNELHLSSLRVAWRTFFGWLLRADTDCLTSVDK